MFLYLQSYGRQICLKNVGIGVSLNLNHSEYGSPLGLNAMKYMSVSRKRHKIFLFLFSTNCTMWNVYISSGMSEEENSIGGVTGAPCILVEHILEILLNLCMINLWKDLSSASTPMVNIGMSCTWISAIQINNRYLKHNLLAIKITISSISSGLMYINSINVGNWHIPPLPSTPTALNSNQMDNCVLQMH